MATPGWACLRPGRRFPYFMLNWRNAEVVNGVRPPPSVSAGRACFVRSRALCALVLRSVAVLWRLGRAEIFGVTGDAGQFIALGRILGRIIGR